jgi:hypothetical protein
MPERRADHPGAVVVARPTRWGNHPAWCHGAALLQIANGLPR